MNGRRLDLLYRNSPGSFGALQCDKTVRPAARARPVRSKALFMRRDQPNDTPSGVLREPRNLMCSQHLEGWPRQPEICSVKPGGRPAHWGPSQSPSVPNFTKRQASRPVSRSIGSGPQSLRCLSESSGHGPSSCAQLITSSAMPSSLADIEPCTTVRPKGVWKEFRWALKVGRAHIFARHVVRKYSPRHDGFDSRLPWGVGRAHGSSSRILDIACSHPPMINRHPVANDQTSVAGNCHFLCGAIGTPGHCDTGAPA